MALTREQIVSSLKNAGLKRGDSVVLHASYRSLGAVDGGADTVLNALLEVLTPEGNLMLPTFNYSRPLPEPHFDPVTTACRTGIIPELGRQRPDAMRSLHPTHSVTVIGRDTSTLTENHLQSRAFGVGSPLDRLAERNGKILLLGVGQTSNSMIHVAEEHAGIPKACATNPLPTVGVLLPDGTIVQHQLDSSPSCSAAFEAAAYPLRRANVINDARIGGALVQVMKTSEVIETIVRLLKQLPDALLCSYTGCTSCNIIRANLNSKNE